MCVTTYILSFFFVSLSLHDLWSIVKLWYWYSISMTHWHNVHLANIVADAKHACRYITIIKNYDSLTQCTSYEQFTWCKTRLPDNRKLWLSDWSYILQTFYAMQNMTRPVAKEGPWLITTNCWCRSKPCVHTEHFINPGAIQCRKSWFIMML